MLLQAFLSPCRLPLLFYTMKIRPRSLSGLLHPGLRVVATNMRASRLSSLEDRLPSDNTVSHILILIHIDHREIGLLTRCLRVVVIQLARLSGFSPIVATASLHNAEHLKSLGATHVVDRTLPAEQLQAEATKLGGGLFDLVYDAVSLTETLPIGNALTAPGGDLVVVSPAGLPQGGEANKKVHLARGLLVMPTNHIVGASLLAQLPKLLEDGDIKVRGYEVTPLP